MERFTKIAFYTFVVHTGLNFAFYWLAFLFGLASFNDGRASGVCDLIVGLCSVLNLPVVYFQTGEFKIDSSILTPWPSLPQFMWTTVFALIIATTCVTVIRAKSPAHQPSSK